MLAVVPPTLVAAEGVRWTVGGRAEASRCALLRGVIPLLADPSEGLSEDTMLRHALATALEAGLVRRSDFVCVSHKLRDDWSISVLCVGSDGADGDAGVAGLGCGGYGPLAGGGDSSASLASLLARTPSAADLRTAGRPDRRRSSRF